ncbi:hypothetical protein [Rhizobium leguminosarum]|uniref:hypothetical protein n=1 Tax=Rhizobium leguminosarum TaxID=384 RepID=UPI001AE6F92F|nr:hypothetical protein [Rhizobium leguminosarum]MBP2444747.1 hypothetical protein [Rhizobium leguminosarum]
MILIDRFAASASRLAALFGTACGAQSIINLGELLFKALLMNCGHDKAAPQPTARSRPA